ncbi:MAG: hypothetical protein ACSNEK_01845 [Parachlamydiaceae bacterium]
MFTYGLDIHFLDAEGGPYYSMLCITKKFLTLLVAKGANQYHRDANGQPLLHEAASDEEISLDVLSKAPSHGLDLEEQNNNRSRPLFGALDNPAKQQLRLARGVNIQHRTKGGTTIFDLAEEINDP